jgi:hypothetical protein
MPRKSFQQCLGVNGQLISEMSQAFVEDHIYVNNGACNSMCVQKMCGLIKGKLPSEKEMLEVAQWAREERGKCTERISAYAESGGVKKVAEYKGRWLYDELYGGLFLQKTGFYYYMIGLYNTSMSEGHALLAYIQDDKWQLFDPNFGTARFASAGSFLLAFKRILENIYPDFGPYYPVVIWRFDPLG